MDQSKGHSEPDSGRHKHQESATYDADLEWYLVAGDAAMGARGTLGGVIAQLEHGGPFTGVPSTDLYNDQQVGWGRSTIGLVERHRWLSNAWFLLAEQVRSRLCLRYQAARAKYRGDQLTGSRSGAEAQLGEFAALALTIVPDVAQLVEACFQPQKGKHSAVIKRAVKLARDASTADHALWAEAKTEAGKPRSRLARVSILPPMLDGDQE